MSQTKQRLLYLGVVLFSVLYLVGGYRLTREDANMFRNEMGVQLVAARVQEVLRSRTNIGELGGNYYKEQISIFQATLLEGPDKGRQVTAFQLIDGMTSFGVSQVEAGDKIFLRQLEEPQHGADWEAGDYYRSDQLLLLTGIFLLGLLAFGRWRGFHTILSLAFTVLAVFAVFVPAILAGYNAYLVSLVTCVYIIAMTLCLVSGFTRKSLASALGCVGGVLVVGLLTVVMSHTLKLTGFLDDNSLYVYYLNEENPISMIGVIFAANIIGAVGATMDVSMSISSALGEITEKLPTLSIRQIFASGMNIGRDVMGTMSNTLILAYIGSSLTTVLLFVSYQASLEQLLNREIIVVELFQAIAGSLGILFTIPISALIASLLYHRPGRGEGETSAGQTPGSTGESMADTVPADQTPGSTAESLADEEASEDSTVQTAK